jgi:hypothetical protein
MVLIDGGPEGMQWFSSPKKEKNMEKGITAEEARRKSKTILGEKVKTQLYQCEEAINKAIVENKMSANVIFQLEHLAKKDLEDRGFTIKYTDGDFRVQRDRGYTTLINNKKDEIYV